MEELESGCPALRSSRKGRQILRRERLKVNLSKESLDLPRTEAQVVWTDVDKTAAYQQAGHIKARGRGRRDQDGEVGGGRLDQGLDDGFSRTSLECVVVIDEQP